MTTHGHGKVIFAALILCFGAVGFAMLSTDLVPARAEPTQLKGHMFISVMKDNTLSGQTGDGVAYNLYFLSGGAVTYHAADGDKDTGRWHIGDDGRLCVKFVKRDQGKENCFVVELEGRTLSWRGENGVERGTLRGGIADSFLEN